MVQQKIDSAKTINSLYKQRTPYYMQPALRPDNRQIKSKLRQEPRAYRTPFVFILILGLLGMSLAPAQASSLDDTDELGEQLSNVEAESLAEESSLLDGVQSSLDPDDSGPQAWEYGDDHYLVVHHLQDNLESFSSVSALVDSEGNVTNRFETAMNLITDDYAEITMWVDGEQTAYESMSLSEAESQGTDCQVSPMSSSYFDSFLNCITNQFDIPVPVQTLITSVCTATCIGFPPGCVGCVAGLAGVTGGMAGYCHGQAR